MTHKRNNEGFRYEEQVIALVFLRCLRKRLRDFELTSENRLRELESGEPLDDSQMASGEKKARAKYDDVVVTWKGTAWNLWDYIFNRKYILAVQLKHTEDKTVKLKKAQLFPERKAKPDASPRGNTDDGFAIADYYSYYTELKLGEKLLQCNNYALVLLTNRPIGENVQPYLEDAEGDKSIVERIRLLQLLDAGGCVYRLKADTTVLETVGKNREFMKQFFLYCGQRSVGEIKKDIWKELDDLLGSPGIEKTTMACDELCKSLENWKDGNCEEPGRLTSSWSKWEEIRDKYKSK